MLAVSGACAILALMTSEQSDRLLTRIIIYGFSLSFGAVIASSQALRPTSSGFAIVLSWWTLLALIIGAAVMVPFFWLIVCSNKVWFKRTALALVVLIGLGAFFYPLRVVPRERFGPVFVGLAVAVVALSILASMLLLLHRFFEREQSGSR